MYRYDFCRRSHRFKSNTEVIKQSYYIFISPRIIQFDISTSFYFKSYEKLVITTDAIYMLNGSSVINVTRISDAVNARLRARSCTNKN